MNFQTIFKSRLHNRSQRLHMFFKTRRGIICFGNTLIVVKIKVIVNVILWHTIHHHLYSGLVFDIFGIEGEIQEKTQLNTLTQLKHMFFDVLKKFVNGLLFKYHVEVYLDFVSLWNRHLEFH